MSQPSEPATTTPAERFQELWLQGGIPDLASFLETQKQLSNADLVAVLRVDQAERWNAQDRQRSEAYFARFPAVANDPEAALDLIYAEYLLRKQHGPPPTIAEFLDRFPLHGVQLGPQLQLDALAESGERAPAEEIKPERAVGRSLETNDHLASTALSPNPAGGSLDAYRQSLPANGRIIGNYRLLRELGRGGMGTVWEAEMLGNGRRVALKLVNRPLSRESEEAAQFLREAQLAASISHPRSAFVLEAGWHEGQPFLVMELMPGKTLRSVVVEGDITITQAIDYVLDVLDGVEAAHARGVIHRDIKPANCFLDGEGRATIGDYGLALPLLDDPLEGRFAGTPAFASPEQIRVTRLDERTDQYSLGATLYFLLARRPPFVGSFTSLIAQVAADPPPPLASYVIGLPRGLERIIRRTLEKEPAKRFASLASLRQALLPFSSSGTFLANIGRRLAAYAIDDALLIAVGMVVLIFLISIAAILRTSQADGVQFPDGVDFGRLASLLVFNTLSLSYFTIAEGRFGCGLGKWLIGLRVVGPDGGPPGLARAAMRAFFVPFACGWVLLDPLVVPLQPFTQEAMENFNLYQLLVLPSLLGAVSNIPLLLILAPAFFRADFCGLQDLVSGTRVIALKSRARRPSALITSETKVAGAAAAERPFGPYSQVAVRQETPEFTLYEATDEVLRRQVRIVLQSASRAPTYNRVNLSRPTRNRWLQGGSDGDQRWDAYEAASGRPLLKVLRQGPRDWETMRIVLLDLAEEIQAAAVDGTLPDAVSLAQLFQTSAGRLQLFELPLSAPTEEQSFRGKSRGWLLFQRLVQTSGLDPGWPVHARSFCEQALARTEREGAAEWAARELRDMAHRPATIRWDDRLGVMSLAIVAEGWVFALLMLVGGGLIASLPGLDSSLRFMLLGLICLGMPGLTTLLWGRSLLLRLLHIQIRRADGSAAGRLRSFLRITLAWLPWTLSGWLFGWAVGTVAVVFALDGPDPHDRLNLMRELFLLLGFLGGNVPLVFLVPSAWFALQNPTRGLAERLSGTRLVYD